MPHYHPTKWPRLTPAQKFVVAVGAILTQNTAWKNVEQALANLRRAKILTVAGLWRTPSARLEKMVRPAGYFRQKAKKLKLLAQAWSRLARAGRVPAREELLALWGVGEETADSILLYAFNQPFFVVDVYTRRFCSQHQIIFKTYGEYQNFFQKNLPPDYKIFQEFHALLVAWGKEN